MKSRRLLRLNTPPFTCASASLVSQSSGFTKRTAQSTRPSPNDRSLKWLLLRPICSVRTNQRWKTIGAVPTGTGSRCSNKQLPGPSIITVRPGNASCARSTKSSGWRGWTNTASKSRSGTTGASTARRFTRSSRKWKAKSYMPWRTASPRSLSTVPGRTFAAIPCAAMSPKACPLPNFLT